MKTENKWNNKETEFNCKADAFQWFNDTIPDIDNVKIYYGNQCHYTKSILGTYSNIEQVYINGKLPVEYYD